jgi:hypothetical protein
VVPFVRGSRIAPVAELTRLVLVLSDHIHAVKPLIEVASKWQGGPAYFIHIGGTVRAFHTFGVK